MVRLRRRCRARRSGKDGATPPPEPSERPDADRGRRVGWCWGTSRRGSGAARGCVACTSALLRPGRCPHAAARVRNEGHVECSPDPPDLPHRRCGACAGAVSSRPSDRRSSSRRRHRRHSATIGYWARDRPRTRTRTRRGGSDRRLGPCTRHRRCCARGCTPGRCCAAGCVCRRRDRCGVSEAASRPLGPDGRCRHRCRRSTAGCASGAMAFPGPKSSHRRRG